MSDINKDKEIILKKLNREEIFDLYFEIFKIKIKGYFIDSRNGKKVYCIYDYENCLENLCNYNISEETMKKYKTIADNKDANIWENYYSYHYHRYRDYTLENIKIEYVDKIYDIIRKNNGYGILDDVVPKTLLEYYLMKDVLQTYSSKYEVSNFCCLKYRTKIYVKDYEKKLKLIYIGKILNFDIAFLLKDYI